MGFWDLFGENPAGIDCPPLLEQTEDAIIAPEDYNPRAPGAETLGPTLGRQGRLSDTITAGNKDIFE